VNVLSLFDGMSCGMIALERAGIKVDKYYSSEIDKYTIKVSRDNYPKIIRLGDVLKWKEWGIDWSTIDLIIGGSPCQGFSFIGGQQAFDDPRGALFYKFVEIVNWASRFNFKGQFLLENNRMKQEHLDVITEHLCVLPTLINSSLVSAQDRKRYYWTNWDFKAPEDKGIVLQDILEHGTAHRLKSKTVRVGGRGSNDRHEWDKADTTGRRYTVTELERLQTIPDGYCQGVSTTQAYKMLGNGWNVDTIASILKQLNPNGYEGEYYG